MGIDVPMLPAPKWTAFLVGCVFPFMLAVVVVASRRGM